MCKRLSASTDLRITTTVYRETCGLVIELYGAISSRGDPVGVSVRDGRLHGSIN